MPTKSGGLITIYNLLIYNLFMTTIIFYTVPKSKTESGLEQDMLFTSLLT